MAQCLEFLNALMNKSYCYGDVPDGPVAKTPYPQWRGLGSIPGQGTRSLMPQLRVHKPSLKIPHAAMKIENPTCQNKNWHSQINKKKFKGYCCDYVNSKFLSQGIIIYSFKNSLEMIYIYIKDLVCTCVQVHWIRMQIIFHSCSR